MKRVLGLMLLLSGCGNVNTLNSVSGDAGVYSSDLSAARQIIVSKCASCHFHSDYTFKTDADWSADTLIVPGNANASTLVRRLKESGVEGVNPALANMPLDAAPLSLSEIDTIKNWINNDL